MVWDYSFHLALYGYCLKTYTNGGTYIHVLDLLNSNFYFRGSGIGFIIHEKYIEAIIAFVICLLFMVLLYFYLKRNKKRRNLDCDVIDCTDCSDCDCTN